MKVRTAALGVALAATSLLAGCASGAAAPHGAATRPGEMPAGMVMPDGSTMAPGSPGTAPSAAARMICSAETRNDIAAILSVAPAPDPAATWRGGTYTCTYRLPSGTIVLSVHESPDGATAAAYTSGQRKAMPGARDLAGLTPIAFGTPDGLLVLRKDDDTLRVDTTALAPRSDPRYRHRAEFGYEIAAVILGCWTGG